MYALSFQWYSRGEVRWVVLGTDNGGKIVTTTNDRSYKSWKIAPKGVFVPDELLEEYKAHSYWSQWASYLRGISEFKTLVTDVTGEELPSEE